MTNSFSETDRFISHDTILYSPSADACFVKGFSSDIPDDAVEVHWDNYVEYWLGKPPEGTTIAWNDATHIFYWKMADPIIELTLEQKQQQLRAKMSEELNQDIHTGDRVYAGDIENRLDILKAKLNGGGHVRNGETVVELDEKLSEEVYQAMMDQNKSIKIRYKKLFDELLQRKHKKSKG